MEVNNLTPDVSEISAHGITKAIQVLLQHSLAVFQDNLPNSPLVLQLCHLSSSMIQFLDLKSAAARNL
jgi:hypothetical protein